MAAMLAFAGCGAKISDKEKNAAGSYKLADIELQVESGAIGVNLTAHTIKATEILSYINDFNGVSTESFAKLYKSEKDTSLTLSADKKKSGYLSGSRVDSDKSYNIKWKVYNDKYIKATGLELYAFTSGTEYSKASCDSGYIASDSEIWFSVITDTCTLKYIFTRAE